MCPVQDVQENTIVLLDIENEVYAVLEDPSLAGYNFFDSMTALLTCIDRLAGSIGAVLYRFAAMAIIDGIKEGPFDRKKREVMREILTQQFGYEVSLPTFALGVADEAIIAKAQELFTEGAAKKWLLVTGDGKKNYSSLCRKLLIANHMVHWTSYRAIHGPLHYLYKVGKGMQFSHSVLSSNTVLTQLTSLRGAPGDRSSEKIQGDFQLFLLNPEDTNIEERRRKTIDAVIRAVVEISNQRLADYLDLVIAARVKLREVYILDVTDAELNALVQAIIQMDLIQPQTAYTRTPGSRFLEWYQKNLAHDKKLPVAK